MTTPIALASRRELFVDKHLIHTLRNVDFKLHQPHLESQPLGFKGDYLTVLHDGQEFKTYYRAYDPSFTGEKKDGNDGEATFLATSHDGIHWSLPALNLIEINGSKDNNACFRANPFSHNFAPFFDTNPAAQPAARFKALAGVHAKAAAPHAGLHAFQSPDGIHWSPMQPDPVLTHEDFAFDSQNVSFWSPSENQYVCYFRTWVTPHGRARTISRSTSPDFIHWSTPVPMNPNLPGEHLYTSQTSPYFRAPHFYISLPTRFIPSRGSSTDVLFMTSRAGANSFDRLFTQAFIRPGLDPNRWGNRSNYAACGILPTGPNEISIYHGRSGTRYSLRTDGFVSLTPASETGTVTTKPFTFTGSKLSLNLATSAAGSVKVELQDADGNPIPDRTLADCPDIFTDTIDHTVTWKSGPDLSALQGKPVRLKFELQEADLYSLQFQ
jgi:hypothetical protein